MNDAIKMQISAFVDGELPDNEAQLLLRRLTQDPDLRNELASYLAIGRAMRGQRALPGMNELRGRIAAAIDNKEEQADFDAIEPVDRRLLRPVAGFAIAATVAVVALLGLQRFGDVPDGVPAAVAGVAEPSAGESSYTVPDAYLQLHREASSNINAVLTDFRTREEDLQTTDADAESDPETGEAPDEDAAGTGSATGELR